MKRWMFFTAAAALMAASGCCCVGKNEPKIGRIFLWGTLKSEADTAKYAAAGVTDIQVRTPKSMEWAVKYGITP